VLQYLRQLKLYLNVSHRRLFLVSIVIARAQHADMKYWMEMVVLRYFELVIQVACSSKDLKRSKPKCKHLASANCLECNVFAAQEQRVANIELQVHA